MERALHPHIVDHGACDESKCVSRGRSNGESFTCYGGEDDTEFPRMCADGFLPVVVDNNSDDVGGGGGDAQQNEDMSYFTCCPPSDQHRYSKLANAPSIDSAIRHCSDPIDASATTNPQSLCRYQGEGRTYPRFMKKSTTSENDDNDNEYFMCCDGIIAAHVTHSILESGHHNYSSNNHNHKNATATATATASASATATSDVTPTTPSESTTDAAIPKEANFLDELDCVPYRNEWYEPATAQNDIGRLEVVSCEVPGFEVPTSVLQADTGNSAAAPGYYRSSWMENTPTPAYHDGGPFRYRCCRSSAVASQSNLPPFVTDVYFRVTILPAMVLFTLSAILSAILLIALLIPYCKHKRPYPSSRRTHRTRTRSLPLSSARRKKQFSTYNLYLVYLAGLDLLYSLVQLALYGSTVSQTFYPEFFGSFVANTTGPPIAPNGPYVAANLWIFAIVVHQVLKLLRTHSHSVELYQPLPSRVHLQSFAAIVVSVVLGYLLSLLNDALQSSGSGDLAEQGDQLRIVLYGLMGLVFVPPIGHVVCAMIVVLWNRYIPSKSECSGTANGGDTNKPDNIRASMTSSTLTMQINNMTNGPSTSHNKETRELALLFIRLVGLFFAFWIPALLLNHYGGPQHHLLSIILIGLQPILRTVLVMVSKEDAKKYVCNLLFIACSPFCCGASICSRLRGQRGGTSRAAAVYDATRTSHFSESDNNRDSSTMFDRRSSITNHQGSSFFSKLSVFGGSDVPSSTFLDEHNKASNRQLQSSPSTPGGRRSYNRGRSTRSQKQLPQPPLTEAPSSPSSSKSRSSWKRLSTGSRRSRSSHSTISHFAMALGLSKADIEEDIREDIELPYNEDDDSNSVGAGDDKLRDASNKNSDHGTDATDNLAISNSSAGLFDSDPPSPISPPPPTTPYSIYISKRIQQKNNAAMVLTTGEMAVNQIGVVPTKNLSATEAAAVVAAAMAGMAMAEEDNDRHGSSELLATKDSNDSHDRSSVSSVSHHSVSRH